MPGLVLTVMNMKGGVGKTTVAAHLGAAVGVWDLGTPLKRRRVLLIDYDPQFNLSQALLPSNDYFNLEKKRKHSLAILRDDETTINPFVLQVPASVKPPKLADLAHPIWDWTNGSAVHLVPSTLDLMFVALGEPDKRIDALEQRFASFINEARSQYDLVVIDCHPAGSVLTKTSLRNSDHVLIPVAPEAYAVRGVGLMMRFVDASRIGQSSLVPHILFNRMPRTGTASEEITIRADPKVGKYCMANTLKRFKAFAEPHEGKGFVWWNRKSYTAQAKANLQAVATELVTRLSL